MKNATLKIAAAIALFTAACGSTQQQPQQSHSDVKQSTYVAPSEEARTCCECLQATACYVPPQNDLEVGCLDTIGMGGVPNYVSSCLAGEPNEYPNGVCTDECGVLFE